MMRVLAEVEKIIIITERVQRAYKHKATKLLEWIYFGKLMLFTGTREVYSFYLFGSWNCYSFEKVLEFPKFRK